jgi:MoaA/NifB/PqqE/SkfB family radical SAM enzyme
MSPVCQDILTEYLEGIACDSPTKIPAYTKTSIRKITRRGIMWVGQTCNLRCHFCYYLDRIQDPNHPEHDFMTVEKAKEICRTLVEVYGNSSVDIQGGEPTLMPGILELIEYCAEIGLATTLITNAQALHKKSIVQKYKDAGVRDFLVSLQALGPVYDQTVSQEGAYKRQIKAIKHLREVGIPFRFNCVLSQAVLPQLSAIADLAATSGALVVNFLGFNPFDDQRLPGKRSTENVPEHSEVGEALNAALDRFDELGIEANVRYLPLCLVDERHRSKMYTFHQLPYDVHENDFASWSWTGQRPQRTKLDDLSPPPELGRRVKLGWLKKPARKLLELPVVGQRLSRAKSRLDGVMAKTHNALSGQLSRDDLYQEDARLRAQEHCDYRHVEACSECDARSICHGLYGDYVNLIGDQAVQPIQLGRKVTDPREFIRQQTKLVHPDDLAWLESSES